VKPCAVKRGILTLRECGEKAGDTCGVCRRHICQAHATVRGGQMLCLECDARQQQEELAAVGTRGKPAAQEAAPEVDTSDRRWPYRYRERYYASSHYQPFYAAHYWDRYYDHYDVRSFDRQAAGMAADQDETAGGFYDS
jgi:hypothetical protein